MKELVFVCYFIDRANCVVWPDFSTTSSLSKALIDPRFLISCISYQTPPLSFPKLDIVRRPSSKNFKHEQQTE
ncbi:hypothetical protein RB195_016784 [Necator americanus]|uniref:Uncharacterized protein n=1 Tax=Necator americanus TaxID=51031 RepID=A0ABR1C5B9_NECAM